MAKKSSSRTIRKKKNWYKIIAPKIFSESEIGETMALAPEDLVGRTVKSSLTNFTRNMKKQSITLSLKVNEIKDNKAMTQIQSYMTSPSAVKRLVRRRRDKVEDSIVAKTKDSKLVRVKPMVLTRANASNPVLTDIRHVTRYLLITELAKMTYGEFIEKVLNDKFVKNLKKTINAVYPVKMVNIRAFKLEENAKTKLTSMTKRDKEVFNAVSKKPSLSEKPEVKKDVSPAQKTEEKSVEKSSEKSE